VDPRSTILGYPCAAVRENDRLDNDREVGIVLLDESDTEGESTPGKNVRQRRRQSGMTLT